MRAVSHSMGEPLQTLMANLLNSFYPLAEPYHIVDTLPNFPYYTKYFCNYFCKITCPIANRHPVSRYYEILSSSIIFI